MANQQAYLGQSGAVYYDDAAVGWYPAPNDTLPMGGALCPAMYVTDDPVYELNVTNKKYVDANILFELNADKDIQPKIRLGLTGGHYNIIPTLKTSGLLTVGVTYKILDWITDDDFVNVGGTNVDGTVFVATGTTPTHWTHASKLVGYQSLGSATLPWDKIYVTNVYAVGVNVSGLTASLPVITDGSKNLVSIAYTGTTSFRKNLGLETDDSPTFNQVNATTLHTTTILADHIGEHVSAHGVVFDNDLLRVGKLSIDHVAEATSAHGVVFDNDLLRVGKLSIDHIAEATGAHTIVFDNTLTIGSLEGILKAATGVVAAATIGVSLSYSAPTLDAIQDIRTIATPQFAAVRLSDLDASHYLALIFNQAEAAASRTLNFILGSADRTITLSGNPTLADWFDQAIKEASGPSFDHLHLTIAGGTAPLNITSTTMCSNLNADLLDGMHASSFWGGGASVDHALLSTIHSDTLAASAVLGDIIHGNVTPAWARLAGNTAATKKFLAQTGTGAISAVPAWDTIVDGDVPATHSGSAHHVAVTLATAGDTLLGLSGQALDLDTQAANLLFAGPVSGAVAAPTFRALVDADFLTTLNPTITGLTLTKTETLNADNVRYPQFTSTYTIAPNADAALSLYFGSYENITVPVTNTQPIYIIYGHNTNVLLYGTGAIADVEGTLVDIFNQADNVTNIKSLWSHIANYKTVSGFCYGLQNDVNNWATASGGTGSIVICRAQRLLIQNATQAAATGAAHIDTAQIVYGNIANKWTAGGTPAYGSTIGLAAGFEYDLSNEANCVITNSYGIKLNTPSNLGTITNHYGIYLADQTVAGTTLNYAIYSGGGLVHLANLTASLPVITNATQDLASLAYTGATSFRKNLGLETDDSPVFAKLGIGGVPTQALELFSDVSQYLQLNTATVGGNLGGTIKFQSTRGTIASPTTLAENDLIGKFSFAGYDGGDYRSLASIEGLVDGTVSSGTLPTRLVFKTALDTARLERMRIDKSGNVSIVSLTASIPIVTDASKNLVSLAYQGATSFRKNLGLETDDSPTFNQGNFTTLHTTTILADHIGEHGSAHTVVFDNTVTLPAATIVPDAGTIGLGSGKGLIQFDDETTDFISFSNCSVGIGTTSPYSILHAMRSDSNSDPYKNIFTMTATEDDEAASDNLNEAKPSFGLVFRRRGFGAYTNLAGIYAYGASGWHGGLAFRTKIDGAFGGSPATTVVLTPGGNLGIGTTAPLRRLDINEASGNCLRLIYNDADGSAAYYADFLMGSAGDLTITSPTAKTVYFSPTVFDDLQFPVSDAKVTPNNLLPSWEVFTTNTSEYAFSVNDEVDTKANEIPHWWKQGTAGHAHIHITTKAVPAGAQYAKFTVTFAYADTDEVWVEAPLTAELTIPISTTALTNFYLDLGDLTLTNYLIGAQIRCRIKRIAATGGTEYVGDIFVTQVGIHFEKDTLGSRQEIVK